MSVPLLLTLLLPLALVPERGKVVGAWRLEPAPDAVLALNRDDAVELAWRPLGEALAAARQTGRPVLVYVRAAWCGPCRRLERTALADASVRARLARFHLVRLDLDGERRHRAGPYRRSEAEWAARLGAETTPTLVFVAPDGAVLGRRAGLLTAPDLTAVLDAVLATAASTRSTGRSEAAPAY